MDFYRPDPRMECAGVYPPDRRDRELTEFQIPTLWKSYLYQLQMQAPQPKRITCMRGIPRPRCYGREFHGMISREETDRLLISHGDGSYLVRESQRAPGSYTLCLRFNGATKNFKLFFDGQHYVGDKKFDTIHDLVADGLIALFLESRAADYISRMSCQSTYEASPYMTLNMRRKKPPRPPPNRPLPAPPPFDTGQPSKQLDSPHDYDKPASDEETETTSSLITDILGVQQYEKPHLFKVHNFKGMHWCDLCGNFMWGLIAQGVRCEDCGFAAHRKCSEKVPNDCIPDLKHVKRVFGTDLTTLVKAHNCLRPFLVDMLIKEIEGRGLHSEGLYRVSGFNDSVEALRMSIEREGEHVDISSRTVDDINVLTGVLKLYFRLLPIPLITYESYPYFINAVIKGKTSLDDRLMTLREAVSSLPPAHYQTLKYLIAHLHRVADHQRENLMTPGNLSTVFCPTLMRSPDTLTPDLTSWRYESASLEILIAHSKAIFSH